MSDRARSVPFWIWTPLLFVFAYVICVFDPAIYMAGADLPSHVMASMRLFFTNPFAFHHPLDNTFAQLFEFPHGYTVMATPAVLYGVIFGVLRVHVTNVSLTFVDSLIGIISLISVFYFAKMHMGKKAALLGTLLIAVLPIRIGLSRVYVGEQLIEIATLYASLSALHSVAVGERERPSGWYYLFTFLYIGSDNAFPVGIVIQIAYLYALSGPSLGTLWARARRTFINWRAVPWVIVVVVYVVVALYLTRKGYNTGYLVRLFTHSVDTRKGFDLFNWFGWVVKYSGPLVVLFLLSFINFRKLRKEPLFIFLGSVAILYFLLALGAAQLHPSYLIYMFVPMALFCAGLLERRQWVIIATAAVTLAYSMAIMYHVPRNFPRVAIYGSTNPVSHNDEGFETLGYLLRTGAIPVSKTYPTVFGTKRETYGIFVASRGALWFYLGGDYHNRPFDDIPAGMLSKLDTYIFAYRKDVTDPELVKANTYIGKYLSDHPLHHIATILRGKTVLMELYSNKAAPGNKATDYQVAKYNALFSRRFYRMHQLAPVWLGQF